MNIRVLCTGNSAWSAQLESRQTDRPESHIQVCSAGPKPSGKVHPKPLVELAYEGRPTDGLSSQGWDDYAATGAPSVNAVITVCGYPAGEIWPIRPGARVRAYRGDEDPAAVASQDWDKAFDLAYHRLSRRAAAVQAALKTIGQQF